MKRKISALTLLFSAIPASVFAQDPVVVVNPLDPMLIIATILYGLIGIALCVLGYFAFDRLARLDLQRELVEDQNTALGIMLAGVFIGIAIVVASAIVG